MVRNDMHWPDSFATYFLAHAAGLPLLLQVSGLKSITAKHLAISCQCLGVFIRLHPALTAVFTQGVPQPRRDLLIADFTRTVQVGGCLGLGGFPAAPEVHSFAWA
jgi:hypothetical protein